MGYNSDATGDVSTSMGVYTAAQSYCETVIGQWNATTTPTSATSWESTDRLFIVGNGTSSSDKSNAMVIYKDGRIALQNVYNPTYALALPNNTTPTIGQALANDWDTYSDGRLKTDLHPLPYGLADVMKLRPARYFQHNSVVRDGQIEILGTGAMKIGFVAQELAVIIPEAVKAPADEATGLWSMNTDKLTPVLVKAIQEQQAMISELKRQNEELIKRIETLESK